MIDSNVLSHFFYIYMYHLEASIADFEFKCLVFKSWSNHFFFIGKIVGVTEIPTRDKKNLKSIMLAARPWEEILSS